MQYVSFYAVRHDTGAVLPLATVTVLVSGTTTPALLFNEDGDSIGNPMTATAGGLVGFRTYNGEYDIQISSGSYSAPPITAMSVVDVIEVAADVELIKAGSLLGGVVIFETTGGLTDLDHPAGTLAVVEIDTPADGAVYQKTGASGAGAWTKTAIAIFSGRVDYFATTQTNASASSLQLELVGGFGQVRDIANAMFALDISTAKPAGLGISIEVQGFNDGDPRQLLTADGEQVPDGAWVAGQRLLFKWVNPYWVLVMPSAAIASGGGGGTPVMATQTNVSGYELILQPQGSFAAATTLFFEIVTLKPDGFGVTIVVEGFNEGDPRPLVVQGGAQIADGLWDVGDLIAIRFNTTDGKFYLKPFLDLAGGGGGGGGVSLSYYQQVQAKRTNASAAAARRLGLANKAALALKQDLNANLTAFGGLTGAANKLGYFTGAGAISLCDLSSFGRSLIDDADAGAARTTLGLGTMAVQPATAVAVSGGTAVGLSFLQITGSTPPSLSGSGVEIMGGASGVFQAYNRTGGAYIPFNIDASVINFRPNGSGRLVVSSSGIAVSSGSIVPAAYTVATAPAASAHTRGSIYITDMAGGAEWAFSDGTNWRRFSDRSVMS